MKQSLLVIGLASKKELKILDIKASDLNMTLMQFLIAHNFTIASSCGGVGTCQKCIVNHTLLSCQISLRDCIKDRPLTRVEIAYL